jgi:hypothetical protein
VQRAAMPIAWIKRVPAFGDSDSLFATSTEAAVCARSNERAANGGVAPGSHLEALLSSVCGNKAERINQRCARSPDAAGKSERRVHNRGQR